MAVKVEPYKGIAEIYEEIRPSYPEKLIQDVIARAGLKPSDRLLEIGSGTGKATVQFAEGGFEIHAVEPGEDMAEIFKRKCRKYPKVSLDISSFEEWKCPDNETYDMIYCAQAFHWLDTEIKYKKCSKLLKDDGYLVLFWYNPSDNESAVSKEIDQKVEKIIQKYYSNYFVDRGKPARRAHSGVSKEDERKAEIEASGLFELVDKIEYTQESRNNPQQYLKAVKSVPAFASILDGLDDETIERMDNEIIEVVNSYGGYVSTLFTFSLYITKKVTHDKAILKIGLARIDDTYSIVELLNKVTLNLHQKNINQWNYPWDYKEISMDIDKGNTYIITIDNLIIGTFSIKDLDISSSLPLNNDSNSLYLYRIAILPEYQGNNIGRKAIDYAYVISRSLKKSLYLDCWAGNVILKNFYLKAGLELCGDFPEEDYMISVFKYR